MGKGRGKGQGKGSGKGEGKGAYQGGYQGGGSARGPVEVPGARHVRITVLAGFKPGSTLTVNSPTIIILLS
jgi:hypothetical protein